MLDERFPTNEFTLRYVKNEENTEDEVSLFDEQKSVIGDLLTTYGKLIADVHKDDNVRLNQTMFSVINEMLTILSSMPFEKTKKHFLNMLSVFPDNTYERMFIGGIYDKMLEDEE